MEISSINNQQLVQTLFSQNQGSYLQDNKSGESSSNFSYSDTNSISSFSNNINKLYQEIQESGDQKALQAFRDSVMQMASGSSGSSGPTDVYEFVDIGQTLQEREDNSVSQTFSTMQDLSEKGLSTDTWYRNLQGLNSGQTESYLDISENIASSENESDMQAAFSNLVNTLNQINSNSEISEEQQNSAQNDLFSRVEGKTDMQALNNSVQGFKEDWQDTFSF